MSISLHTNLASLGAQRNHASNGRGLGKVMRQIVTGNRTHEAAADAAGLAVSENLSASIDSSKVAWRNANDGISLIQTAEGGMKEVGDILKRMRELAVQASSETLNDNERAFASAEFIESQKEIARIRQVTEFNGIKLLDGSQSAGLQTQVGVHDSGNDRIAIQIGDVASTSTISGGGGGSPVATITSGTIDANDPNKSNLQLGPPGSIGTGTATTIATSPDGVSHWYSDESSALARANAINAGTGTHGVTATFADDASVTVTGNITGGTYTTGDTIQILGGTAAAPLWSPPTNLTIQANDSDRTFQNWLQTELDASYGTGTLVADTTSNALKISASDGRSIGYSGTTTGGTGANVSVLNMHPGRPGGHRRGHRRQQPEPLHPRRHHEPHDRRHDQSGARAGGPHRCP